MCFKCDGMTDDQYARLVEQNINAHGWTVQHVEADGNRNPSFAYTLGLSLRGHPELITFGCHPYPAYRALEPLALAVLAGRRFDEGHDLSDLYAGRPELLRVPDSTTHLFLANDLFRRPGQPPIPALQLVWPTRLQPMAELLDLPSHDGDV
ncbi:uncharacterized protein DUF4262 [Kribbella voronezhensis]|uniref:Uncharacterized protein DUF4262 n=2 Tax=Kribbella voronezhensis TaxID=2512212 RepID=A0A4V3FJM3_9ACTN|nr:uncharacterized protein DUF4262 [Kribbella voronezhensis]